MNQKFHTNAFRGMLVFLLALTLNACAAQPKEVVVPAAQPTVAMEPTVIPSLTLPLVAPDSADIPPIDVPAYLSRGTKPDVPPRTINGVTVTIDWAYADESRVFVKYTISGLDWPEGALEMASISKLPISSEMIRDITRDRSSWSTVPVHAGTIVGSIEQLLTVDALDAARTPNVDLQVDIPVDGTGAVLTTRAQPAPVDLPNVGTFHFEFEIPVYQGIKIMDINQSVEANGITMTLKSLILNRSHVDALLCIPLPSAQDWELGPEVRFGLSSQPNKDYWADWDGASLFAADWRPLSITDSQRCFGVGSTVHYDGDQTSVAITIPKLMTPIPERIPNELIQQANENLSQKGIAFEVITDSNGKNFNNFHILKHPDGMSDEEINILIGDALSSWHEGPWEFMVEVSP
jgi:hypothetical protein